MEDGEAVEKSNIFVLIFPRIGLNICVPAMVRGNKTDTEAVNSRSCECEILCRKNESQKTRDSG